VSDVTGVDGEGLWEEHAGWWQDGFTDGVDAEYEEQIIPIVLDVLAGRDRVLDIGTGEGQIARRLIATDADQVIGVDPTASQVVEAVTRGGGPAYARAAADALPFRSNSFDGALACLVYEHIEAMEAALAETARVLRPGGRFALLLNHPLLQTPGSGWIDDQWLDPPESYWRVGAYLHETSTIEEVQKGVFIPFVHRPLSRYLNAMVDAGLSLSRMLEPAPPAGFLARAVEYEQASAIPRLLVIVADKLIPYP
jgi:SAM-dependent methyltransferase